MEIREAFKHKRYLVAGHRGYLAKYPENTLLSIKKSIEMGVDMIEIDIALSKDLVPVLFHDETLDRTTNGSGLVSNFTLEELRNLDAGIKRGAEFKGLVIPTFEEFCELMKEYPNILLNIDMKYGDQVMKAVEIVLEQVQKCGFGHRCVFNSLDGRVTSYIHQRGLFSEGAPKGLYGMSHFDDGEGGTFSHMDAVCLNIRDIDKDTVEKYQKMGLSVWCWGTDNEDTVRHAMDCGVTLMVCNDPSAAIKMRDM